MKPRVSLHTGRGARVWGGDRNTLSALPSTVHSASLQVRDRDLTGAPGPGTSWGARGEPASLCAGGRSAMVSTRVPRPWGAAMAVCEHKAPVARHRDAACAGQLSIPTAAGEEPPGAETHLAVCEAATRGRPEGARVPPTTRVSDVAAAPVSPPGASVLFKEEERPRVSPHITPEREQRGAAGWGLTARDGPRACLSCRSGHGSVGASASSSVLEGDVSWAHPTGLPVPTAGHPDELHGTAQPLRRADRPYKELLRLTTSLFAD